MTCKDSICVSCKLLNTYETSYGCKNDEIYLISGCLYGGINAGNRKKCKRFEKAPSDVIQRRMAVFNRKGMRDETANNG